MRPGLQNGHADSAMAYVSLAGLISVRESATSWPPAIRALNPNETMSVPPPMNRSSGNTGVAEV